MGRALGDIYRMADTDDDVRVVVLTGTPPAFCAGADFSNGSNVFERSDAPAFSANPVNPPAWRIRKPVIAAVNGHAIGVGFTLTLHCDLRFMAQDAKYGIVQVRRGVMPDAMSHWTLPRLVGLANAADILLIRPNLHWGRSPRPWRRITSSSERRRLAARTRSCP